MSKIKKIFCHKKRIAVLELEGVISTSKKDINFNNLNPILEDIYNGGYNAVVININCPGGSPVQSGLIYSRIKELSKKHNMPTYTFATDIAASGGYFLLCAGNEMYAHRASIVGSIGVISAGFGYVGLMRKLGVTRRIYKSGSNKAMLDPFLPNKKEEERIMNDLAKSLHDYFIEIVKESRKNLNEKDNILFSGAFWSGEDVLKYGLIDGLGSYREVIFKKYGEKVKFKNIKYKKKKSILGFLSNSIPDLNHFLMSQRYIPK